jgi:BioD-like phosphotransacetylase family protein
MHALYITSLKEKAGKTMLCAGLGKTWLDSGKKVGFLKPLPVDHTGMDRDVLFMQKALDLKESVEAISPVPKPGDEIKQAFAGISGEKDIVLIEGGLLKTSTGDIEALNAKVLVVHDYSDSLSNSLEEYKKLGPRLLGLVINKVPESRISRTRDLAQSVLSQAGIVLLGMIPEKRTLMTMSIADLAEALQGKVLSSPEESSELIENLMLGSSTFDRGAAYYSRKGNKAVILWGERPGFRKAALANLQTAALQTSTRCIIISANSTPIPAVAQKADEKHVPLISAPGTIPEIVSALETGFKNLKFNQENKLPLLVKTLSQYFDSQELSRGLGIT